MLKTIFLIIAVLFGLAFLFEKTRSSSKSKPTKSQRTKGNDATAEAEQPRTADEALPTETGKFRVQQVLKQVKKAQEKEQSEVAAEKGRRAFSKSDGKPLPDPFSLEIDSEQKGDS